MVLTVALVALVGCSGLNNDEVPTGLTDPAITKTPQGALQVYRGLLVKFRDAFGGSGLAGSQSTSFVAITGLLTDELQNTRDQDTQESDDVDRRSFPTTSTVPMVLADYSLLQKVRGQASQAIGLLGDYVPDSAALRGHAYAIAGYAEVFLAELYCSGIPLSTLDYNQDYTLKPGSSTHDIFVHAAALFDTALTLAGTDARVVGLARVGKARALLGIGDYNQAASAVSGVADDYAYVTHFAANGNFATLEFGAWTFSVADQEGSELNGLDFISSGDPRTAVVDLSGNKYPVKYAQDGATPIVVASGLEARLIEAEAALQADPAGAAWLDKLNALRTDGTSTPDVVADTLGVTGCGAAAACGSDGASGGTFRVPAGYTLTDSMTIKPLPPALQATCASYSSYFPCANGDSTLVRRYSGLLWHRGSGGVDRLVPLVDPGTDSARVDLLFRERAFWLFLTGHRQGDLRRLIHWYGRSPTQFYPTGVYPIVHNTGGGSGGLYGGDVTVPIPVEERAANPLFTGCASRGA